MFQGSANLGKMEFDQARGGQRRQPQRLDPVRLTRTTSRTCLADRVGDSRSGPRPDRMRSLDDQRGEPQEPEGGGEQRGPRQRAEPALRRPSTGSTCRMYANQNWYNAHNFYGDLTDLDAATHRRTCGTSSRRTTRRTTRCSWWSATWTRPRCRAGRRSTSRTSRRAPPACSGRDGAATDEEKRLAQKDALAEPACPRHRMAHARADLVRLSGHGPASTPSSG